MKIHGFEARIFTMFKLHAIEILSSTLKLIACIYDVDHLTNMLYVLCFANAYGDSSWLNILHFYEAWKNVGASWGKRSATVSLHVLVISHAWILQVVKGMIIWDNIWKLWSKHKLDMHESIEIRIQIRRLKDRKKKCDTNILLFLRIILFLSCNVFK